jgi:signal transduction histidine kinase
MEHIQRTFQPIAARQGVELVTDLPTSIPTIQVDEGRTLQVLKNLIENALRYTPKGGKITLGVRSSNKIELIVSDNGAGIDADDLPYVFDRFYQADKARGANSGKMGLGLAICKALVVAQGGTITAESAGKGQGTTMKIAFREFSEEKKTASQNIQNRSK